MWSDNSPEEEKWNVRNILHQSYKVYKDREATKSDNINGGLNLSSNLKGTNSNTNYRTQTKSNPIVNCQGLSAIFSNILQNFFQEFLGQQITEPNQPKESAYLTSKTAARSGSFANYNVKPNTVKRKAETYRNLCVTKKVAKFNADGNKHKRHTSKTEHKHNVSSSRKDIRPSTQSKQSKSG